MREQLKKDMGKDLPYKEVSKLMAAKWKSMSNEDKQKYNLILEKSNL